MCQSIIMAGNKILHYIRIKFSKKLQACLNGLLSDITTAGYVMRIIHFRLDLIFFDEYSSRMGWYGQ